MAKSSSHKSSIEIPQLLPKKTTAVANHRCKICGARQSELQLAMSLTPISTTLQRATSPTRNSTDRLYSSRVATASWMATPWTVTRMATAPTRPTVRTPHKLRLAGLKTKPGRFRGTSQPRSMRKSFKTVSVIASFSRKFDTISMNFYSHFSIRYSLKLTKLAHFFYCMISLIYNFIHHFHPFL